MRTSTHGPKILFVFLIAILSCQCTNDESPVVPKHEQPGDSLSPFVTNVRPADGSIGEHYDLTVSATFSEPMDLTTINENTCFLKKGTIIVPCNVESHNFTYDSTHVVSLKPTSWLEFSTTYTATITSGCKDTVGNELKPEKSWSFTTMPPCGALSVGVTDYELGDGIQDCIVTTSLPDTLTEMACGGYSGWYIPVGTYTVTASHNLYNPSPTKQVTIIPYELASVAFQLVTTEFGEPNDNFASATPIQTGIVYSPYIRVENDLDFFSVSANSGDTLRATVTSPTKLGTCEWIVQVFDPSRVILKTVRQHGLFPETQITVVASVTGNYFLKFSLANMNQYITCMCSSGMNSYRLTVDLVSPTLESRHGGE